MCSSMYSFCKKTIGKRRLYDFGGSPYLRLLGKDASVPHHVEQAGLQHTIADREVWRWRWKVNSEWASIEQQLQSAHVTGAALPVHVSRSRAQPPPTRPTTSPLSALISSLRLGSMWQDNNAAYGASSSQNQYYPQQPVAPQPGVPLQFYAPSPVGSTFYSGSRSSLEGHVGAQGSIQQGGAGYGGNIQPVGGWWTAFGTGGFEGEPPLLEGVHHVILARRSTDGGLQNWE